MYKLFFLRICEVDEISVVCEDKSISLCRLSLALFLPILKDLGMNFYYRILINLKNESTHININFEYQRKCGFMTQVLPHLQSAYYLIYRKLKEKNNNFSYVIFKKIMFCLDEFWSSNFDPILCLPDETSDSIRRKLEAFLADPPLDFPQNKAKIQVLVIRS